MKFNLRQFRRSCGRHIHRTRDLHAVAAVTRSRSSAMLACLALITPGQIAAQDASATVPYGNSFRVDDSGTVVLDPVLAMQWNPVGRSGASSIVSARTRVNMQLSLTNWIGRRGRIYMVLPRTSGPSVRATWTTGGGLLPGTPDLRRSRARLRGADQRTDHARSD